MTYQEIKTALKSFQAQVHIIPPLNSKREILETALAELQALTAVVEDIEVTIAPLTPIEETTVESVQTAIALSPEFVPAPKRIRPEHPTLTELREYARLTELALVWAIALVRSLIRFSTPYLVWAGKIALRVAVVTAVIAHQWLLPKVILIAYQLGIWVLTIVLRLTRRWEAIA